MVRGLLLLFVGWVLAQSATIPTASVWLAGKQTTAAFPARASIPYLPAEEVAQALGLGYRDGERIYLSLGSQSVAFGKYYSQTDAIRSGGAWKREGRFWVPLPELARSLALDYRESPVALGLPRATLLEASEQPGRLVLRLDRDVQARIENNRLQLLGVSRSQAANLKVQSRSWGLEVVLPPDLTRPGIQPGYLPRQVLLQDPERQQPWLLLDPGHGGSDGGIRQAGLLEKTITLEMAQGLGSLLNTPLIRLTRQSDQNVTIADRMGEATYAPFFVSLHLLEKPGPGLIHYLPADRRPTWMGNLPTVSVTSQKLAQNLAQALEKAGIPAETRATSMAVLTQAGGAALVLELDPATRQLALEVLAQVLRPLLETRP